MTQDYFRRYTIRLITVLEGATRLGVAPRTLQRLIAAGVLRTVRLANVRRVLVDERDLEKLIANAKE
jgi:excisionase family DNA binding protein